MVSSVAEGRLEALQVYKLLQCVLKGDAPHIKKMVQLGVPGLIDLTEPQEGKSALHLASEANDINMVGFLLAQGASPDVRDRKGRTPVMQAAELGHDDVVALLVESRADMKAVDAEGKGVLFYCLSPTKRHQRCLQLALNGMADVNNVSLVGKPVFLQACEQAGDCESMCMSLLERGANPNATSQATGRTALMEAAREGALDLVRGILQRGGNPNLLEKSRMHAAHFAAEGGFLEIIQVMSAYLADLSVMTRDGNTPLHYAARGGFAQCCRFLAQRGCNPKLKNLKGLVASQIAKDNGHKMAMKELKKAEQLHYKYSKPGVVNPNERWALTLHDWSFEHEVKLRAAFEAAEDGVSSKDTINGETFISILLAKGAPVDVDKLQEIVLTHDKKREGHISLKEFFSGLQYLQKAFVASSYIPKKKKKKSGKAGKGKKKGEFILPLPICTLPPDLVQRREDGGPPLFMIESYRHFTDRNRFDRDHPPKHPIEDDSAWYIDEPEKIYINISYCVKTGDLDSLLLAFGQQVAVDIKDRFYRTPLMTACACGNYEVTKFLLKLGADVNACDQYNWTPLHHACHAGQVDIVDLLVGAGAEVDAQALNGATPLMRAIASCRFSCVEYLLQAGANVQAENKQGKNCLDFAWTFGDVRIISLIQTKFDSIPVSEDGAKKEKGTKQEPTSVKVKEPLPTSPLVSKPALMKEFLKESIILQNTRISSAALNKMDISFVPKTVWVMPLTAEQPAQKKEEQRQHHSNQVAFKDDLVPFDQNISEKSQGSAVDNRQQK
ncbi:ankyrin repeat and EF-hand domain-containing protein 1 [Scleropages formosus]|uniref:Ankyrin repeat and EF-hand domain containing 1a n=1 Tax=Scleropages formosus TaxID=113540 RepID=A0A8C9QZM4_SCLFO|nr:ankyrin repeat and EF-hand domain-containing protein 1 [Scleropages formosus]XP_018590620.1 ankyrin repeat and EF-hand domain-containing protein 1 [Scleropages formosus]